MSPNPVLTLREKIESNQWLSLFLSPPAVCATPACAALIVFIFAAVRTGDARYGWLAVAAAVLYLMSWMLDSVYVPVLTAMSIAFTVLAAPQSHFEHQESSSQLDKVVVTPPVVRETMGSDYLDATGKIQFRPRRYSIAAPAATVNQ